MLRIAVLGCGRIGRMHGENTHTHPHANLAGVFDAAETGSPVPVGFGDGQKALILAEAALRSVREGRSVELNEVK